MAGEISIHQVTPDILRVELRHAVQYFQDLGHEQCELVFGWHWGMYYPPSAPWKTLEVLLANVEEEIQKPEICGLDEFGRDDLTIRVPSMDAEFLFCHHRGIHLSFSRPGNIVEDYLARWKSAGLTPVARDCKSADSGAASWRSVPN